MKKLLFLMMGLSFTHGIHAQSRQAEARIFAPGIISLPDTWDEYITFAPDGDLLAFNRSGRGLTHRGRRIYIAKKVDGQWTTPTLAPFSQGPYQDRGPAFSPDGKRLYFSSNRPTDPAGSTPSRRMDIWYVEREEGNKWGAPVWLGATVNTISETEAHPAITNKGNLYFVRFGSTETDIYFSQYDRGAYKSPQKMDTKINTEGPDSHPFIDPDEAFLLYTPTDRADGYGGGDIYIAYNKSGSWTQSKNIGPPVNTPWYEYSAKIGDGGHLYFTRAGFGDPANKPADIYFIPLKDLPIKLE